MEVLVAGCTSPKQTTPVTPTQASTAVQPVQTAPSIEKGTENDKMTDQDAQKMVTEGRKIFRYDTFGDEAYWGDTLKLHQAIAGAANGGFGGGVDPTTALAVGLKVDADSLPSSLVDNLKAGKVNLSDPATTIALLQLDAVVGVKGFFDEKKNLRHYLRSVPFDGG